MNFLPRIAGALLLILLLALICGSLVPTIGAADIHSHWCASRLFLAGSNPYDPGEIARCLGISSEEVVGRAFFHPPWSFSLVGFFGLTDFRTFAVIWLCLSLICAGLSIWICDGIFGISQLSQGRRLLYRVFLVTSVPLLQSLFLGQLTCVLLLALCVYLFYDATPGRWSDIWKGVALGVLMLKPHFVFFAADPPIPSCQGSC